MGRKEMIQDALYRVGILQAYADGEELQFYDTDDGWQDRSIYSPLPCLESHKYRVKPADMYVNVYEDSISGFMYRSLDVARASVYGSGKTYKLEEVV